MAHSDAVKKYIIEPFEIPIQQGHTSKDQKMDDNYQFDKDDKDMEKRSVKSECSLVESESGDVDAKSRKS